MTMIIIFIVFASFFLDSNIGKIRIKVIQFVLTVVAAILCGIVDIFIWRFSSSMFQALYIILPLNSGVILAYQLIGPMWAVGVFIKMAEIFTRMSVLILTYRTASAIIILVLWAIPIRYIFFINIFGKKTNADGLEGKINVILLTLNGINNKIDKIEKQIKDEHKEIKNRLELIE